LADRRPAAAVRAFLDPLGRALSCVTDAVLRATSYEPVGPHGLVLHGGLPVRLRGARFALTVAMRYRVVPADGERGSWKVTITAYQYGLLDESTRELLAYHWHPGAGEEGRAVAFPHLHVRVLAPAAGRLRRAHLPTGQVALEDVLRLLVRDLGVTPRRRDWAAVLAKTRTAFER